MTELHINSIRSEKIKIREELRTIIKEKFGIEGELLEKVIDNTLSGTGKDPYEDYINYVSDLDALEQY